MLDTIDEERCESVPVKAAVTAASLRNRHPSGERFNEHYNINGNSNNINNTNNSTITRFRSFSGIILRLGLIALAILYCIGSQFKTLRRLHETDENGGDIRHIYNLQLPPKRATRKIRQHSKPIPVSSERRFGTGLIGRINEESLRSKTTTTTTETTTRTRTVGAAANAAQNNNGNRISWPVLGSERSLNAAAGAGTPPYGIRDTQNNQIAWTILQSPVLSEAAEPREEPESTTELMIPEGRKIVPTTTTTTATTTRTRTTGIAAASASSKRIAWPVLNGPIFAVSDRNNEFGVRSNGIFGIAKGGGIDSILPSNDNNTTTSLGNYKIVGFTDYKFRELAIQWYQRLEDLGYREHVLVACDNAVADYLQSLNEERAYELARANETHTAGRSEFEFENENEDETKKLNTDTTYFYRFEKHLLPPVPKDVLKLRREQRHHKGREMIFAWRWHYVLGQLQAGTSILLTDVDNLFNRHLDLTEDPDFGRFDVVHAYGTKPPLIPFGDEPQEQAPAFQAPHEPGFVVGSGMSWLKATPSTIAFVRKLVDRCGTMCDDQQVLNDMIASPKILGIEWDTIENDTIDNEDSEHLLPARTGRSAVTGHRVKIWDQNWVFGGSSGGGDDLRNHQECPLGIGPFRENWVSMLPRAVPAATTTKRELAKSSPLIYKLALFDSWDRDCGTTLNLDNPTNDDHANTNRRSAGTR